MDYQITKEIIDSCNYLNEMYNKTLNVNATAWFVFDFKNINNASSIYDLINGVYINYIKLNWIGYNAVKKIYG